MKTIDETGRLNNYATSPAMYYSEYPSAEQQRSYLVQGAVAILLVGMLVLTALGVS